MTLDAKTLRPSPPKHLGHDRGARDVDGGIDGASHINSPIESPLTKLSRYRAVRAFTERICEPLATEDYVIQTMPDVSPTKWHLAHTSWFFETFVLESNMAGYQPLDPMYNYLFNSYYNTVGYRHCRPKRGLVSRPTVEQVYIYRAYVDKHMTALLETVDEEAWTALEPIVELGLHHEQQHQELMVTDIKHVFSENPLFPVYSERADDGGASSADGAAAPLASPLAPPLEWIAFDEGIHEVGHQGSGFAFDNEGPRHRVLTPAFELGSRLVTAGEYLAFIEDDGYSRHDLWLSAGWDMVAREQWRAPQYWQQHDDGWRLFTLAGVRTLNPDEPVCHVSYFEADAFSRWAGARLPTEFEWEVASGGLEVKGHFAASMRFHPAPSLTGDGLQQFFGDVWEWTRSDYAPYPGYAPSEGALGEYNGKFMSGQYVLRGGSCATSADHIRSTYRNFFPPDARWQFSGIRLARDPA